MRYLLLVFGQIRAKRMMKAAVLNENKDSFDIEDIQIDSPKGCEVLVEVKASGPARLAAIYFTPAAPCRQTTSISARLLACLFLTRLKQSRCSPIVSRKEAFRRSVEWLQQESAAGKAFIRDSRGARTSSAR